MIICILDKDGDAVYINTAYIVRLDVTDTPQLYIGEASYGDVPNTWAIDPDGDVGPLFAFDERAYTIAEGVDIPDDDDDDEGDTEPIIPMPTPCGPGGGSSFAAADGGSSVGWVSADFPRERSARVTYTMAYRYERAHRSLITILGTTPPGTHQWWAFTRELEEVQECRRVMLQSTSYPFEAIQAARHSLEAEERMNQNWYATSIHETITKRVIPGEFRKRQTLKSAPKFVTPEPVPF